MGRVITDLPCFCGAMILGLLTSATAALAQNPIPELDGNWWATPAWETNVTGVVQLAPRVLSEHGEALMAVFDPVDDPSVRCGHPGAMRVLLSPYPMSFKVYVDHVSIGYELWDETRTIHLSVQETDPDAPHKFMGVSEGRFEDDKLIIETHSLTTGLNMTNGFLWTSEEATIHEEYFFDEESSYLTVRLSLTDSVMLAEPWVVEKQWARYDGELLDYDCVDRERP
jgi:hypothetical protein